MQYYKYERLKMTNKSSWYGMFELDANKAINDLFSGRAGLGLRLDIPEWLYQEFPNTPEFSIARQKLDNALLVWLNAMRRDYTKQIGRLGENVYSSRLCDALITVQLLDLPLITYQLREMKTYWLDWLKPLRLAPERDPALEYWHVLTRRQPENEDIDGGINNNINVWLELACDSRREYLTVALIGLQRIPKITTIELQAQSLLAVLKHVSCLDSTIAAEVFNKQCAYLRTALSISDDDFNKLLIQVINKFKTNYGDVLKSSKTTNEEIN